MTKEEAKYLSKVLEAYSEGKEIEHLRTDGVWDDICKDPTFSEGPMHYRIKPEPKLRFYKNAKEFLKDQNAHGPYLHRKEYNYYILPTYIDDTTFEIANKSTLIYYAEAKDLYEWQDGTPCGIREE